MNESLTTRSHANTGRRGGKNEFRVKKRKDGESAGTWAWCNIGHPQSGIQSLPRELSLPEDGVLRIKPLRELENLRYDEKRAAAVAIRSDGPVPLLDFGGDAVELKVTFEPGAAAEFGLDVYCDQDGRNGFSIRVDRAAQVLRLGAVKAPFPLKPGEVTELRVFLDKNMIEIFANDRQAAVASHRYASGNLAISLISKGGESTAREVRRWKMRSIYKDSKP